MPGVCFCLFELLRCLQPADGTSKYLYTSGHCDLFFFSDCFACVHVWGLLLYGRLFAWLVAVCLLLVFMSGLERRVFPHMDGAGETA